jgi:endonuclease YncB( thermonuclease family)
MDTGAEHRSSRQTGRKASERKLCYNQVEASWDRLRAMLYVGTIRLITLLAIAVAVPFWLESGTSLKARSVQPSPGSIVGWARVIDGDTIDISGTRIRLDGIDAPESAQTCLIDSQPYRCGESATRALANLVQGHEVQCDPTGMDQYRRTIARCRIADSNVNINAWLVREGWAVAYRHYSYAYIPDEVLARVANRGLWAGTFEMPWDFRHETRGQTAHRSAR